MYDLLMDGNGNLRVSPRGQMSLPASARHRWDLDEGGTVGYLDIGDAVVIVPGGVEQLRARMLDEIAQEDWDEAARGFGDPELADE